MGRAVTVYFCT